MKIGIDARFLTHPQAGGFKTYTENLITALAEVDTENEYILYLDRPPSAGTKLPDQSNFISRIVPGKLPLIGMPWREQVGLVRQATRDKLDLFHAPSLTAPLRLHCPIVVTIHDMIWFFPQAFNKGNPHSVQRKMMDLYYRHTPKYAVHRASMIITVSEAAKTSIMTHLDVADDQIWVTHEASSPIYRLVNDHKQIETVYQKYHLTPNFILAIGSADPRKNITTLLQAYALLPDSLQEQFELTIVWTHHFLASEMAEQVKQLELSHRVKFLMQVSNEDLVLLYNAASLFIFPSLYEGFGLPLLEAMACGTPVVAANNSSIPEIASDAALFVEAEDAKGMACTMAKVLTDKTVRLDLVKKGHQRAANFSWEKCARQTITCYEKAIMR
jgi:glycosyltransferase involved in cell wall biosynthesis